MQGRPTAAVANEKRRQVKTLSQGAPLGPDGAMVDCGASVHPPSLKILDEETTTLDWMVVLQVGLTEVLKVIK